MNLVYLTRSTTVAVLVAGLMLFLPALRWIDVAQAEFEVVGCAGSNRIFQGCDFTNGSPDFAWYALEQRAISDLLTVHQLPDGDKSRLLGWERAALRAMLFDNLLAIINKSPAQRTADEQAIYDGLAAFVKEKRLAAAMFARAEYDRWAFNPCGFVAPTGFHYSIPTTCASPTGDLFGGAQPPSLEEFQNYGTAHVSSEFQTAAMQAIGADTAKALGLTGGIALAIGAGIVAGYIGSSLTVSSAIIVAIHPFLAAAVAGTNTASAVASVSGVAAGVTGAVSLAAVAAIVVVAITIAIIQGINVFTAAEIPGKLDAAIAAAQTTPDLAQLVSTDAGLREVFGYFLQATTPDFPATTGVPALQPTDRKFEIDPGSSAQLTQNLVYQGWDKAVRTAYLNGGWFVDSAAGTSRLTLDIDYLDWDGAGWTAWRIGDRFLHTRTGNSSAAPFMSDSIKYKDADGVNRTARIQPVDLTPPSANPVLSPAANAAGWHNTAVSVTWNWSDNPGGSGLNPATCPATTNLSPGLTVLVSCTDAAGNTGHSSASAKIDTEAPVILPPTISPAPNDAGWNNTDVTVTFDCHDGDLPGVIVIAGSISGVASCGPNQTLTTEGKDQPVAATATDVAGNSTTTSVNVSIDKSAPVVTRNEPADTCSQPGTNGWCRGTQTAGFQASDTLSGLADTTQASFTRSSTAEGEAVTIPSGPVSDIAGNVNSGLAAGPFKIDHTAPTLEPVISPAKVILKDAATITPGATDTLSGVDSQTCGALDTSTLGQKQVTCTATDKAGNMTSVTVDYVVELGFGGLMAPYAPPSVRSFKGNTVPLSWQYRDATGAVVDSAHAAPTVTVTGPAECGGGSGLPITVASPGASAMRYNGATKTWHFNWSTRNLADGCYQISIVSGLTGQIDGPLPIALK